MFCAVMEVVGGYKQLLNMPIPAFLDTIKYLEYINKKQTEKMPRMPRMRK
jgi:hypothetical protein